MLNSNEIDLLKAKSINNIKPFNPFFKKLIAGTVNVFGKLLFLFKRNRLPAEVKKILFISLYFNGDVLFQSPLFDSVKKLYPNAEIHFWIKNRAKGIVQGYPYIKRVHYYDNVRTKRFDEIVPFDLKNKMAFFKELRAEKFDLIFDITGLFWTAFAVFYSGAKYSAGYNFHGMDFVYNFSSASVTEGHLIDKHLDLITENDAFSEILKNAEIENKPVFYVQKETEYKIEQTLSDAGLDNTRKKIILHLTAGWGSKRWDLQNFVELAKLIPDRYDIFLIGGQDDVNDNDILTKSVDRKVYDFAGKLSFPETAELIRRAELFIGADSGPLYLAESVGTRTISLFGPTNPLFSAPRGNEHVYFYHKMFCSADDNVQNCKLIAGLNCKTIDCMKMIKPQDVYDAAMAALS